MRGYLVVELLSDACFSMPAAFDTAVDTDVVLDHFGLPMISGKTLRGLLHDTLLSLPDEWDQNADGMALFGKERDHSTAGILRIGDALLDSGVRQWARWAHRRKNPAPVKRAYLRDAFLTRRKVTAIDRQSDAPKSETLRVMRVVPKGLTLRAPITVAGTLTESQIRLLDLLTGCTRHAGLARNRGLGHVRLSVMWDEMSDAEVAQPMPHSAMNSREFIFLALVVHLTAPCLISGDDADPNSRSSRPFITGAALRGAVASAIEHTNANRGLMQDLIVSGDIRFLNAYPAVDGLRALPTPITWRRYKDPRWNDADREADGHDAVLMLAGMDDPDEGTRQLQPMDHHFFASISGRQRPAAAQMRQTIHQQRNRARGASVKGETNIFAYEALEEGQSFIGALAAPADRPDLVSSLQTLLSQPLWLGRSGRASYGGAPIFKIGAPGEAEPGTNHKRIQTGDFFAVRLTSDAILRDAVTGQHDPWSLRAAIEKRFGERAIVTQVFIRSTVCTGYHRLWRSSLPAVRAAAAGSVVLMEACENLSTWDLSTLTANPIGERVADGYGCFTVASDSLNGLSIERSRAEISETGAPSEPESEAMLDAQRRLSDKRLRVFLAYEAIQTAANARGLQGSSVIQRVRGPLRAPATWRRTYADWTSGPAEHQLKPMAREGLMSISMEIRFLHHGKLYRERLRLWDVLRRAVDTEWTPTYEFDEAERQACQITSDNVSKQIWTEARAALAPYYLDVLFRSLARRAQSEGEK